jgi:hypothetical protein
MRTTLSFVAGLSLAACGTTNNNTTIANPPTANGVFPASGFVGRDLRVEVTGDATSWTTATTVSFGAGVTVNSVSVAGPDDLFADITIAPGATPGLQDVVVTDAGGTFTLTKAFELDAAVNALTAGTLAQGSFAAFEIDNKDHDNPFDTSTDANGAFVNIQITGPSGVSFVVGAVTDNQITGSIFVDTDATPGAVTVASGPSGAQVTSQVTDNLAIAARTATAFTKAAPATGTVGGPLASSLFTFVPTASSLETFTITSTDDSQLPTFALLPASGHWADGFLGETAGFFGNQLSQFIPSIDETAATNAPFFVVVVDQSGATGYPFSLAATETTGTPLTQTAANVSVATAQAATVPAFVTGTLASDASTVFFKVTVTAANVTAGKHIHVVTGNGDPFCDDLIDVFGPGVPSANNSLGESDDMNFHEDFQSPALAAAGTYYVEISASSAGFFDPAHNAYVASIVLD